MISRIILAITLVVVLVLATSFMGLAQPESAFANAPVAVPASEPPVYNTLLSLIATTTPAATHVPVTHPTPPAG